MVGRRLAPGKSRNAERDNRETGLSGDDEPFLERALDDKSKGVRTTAARLLSRLPTSAYATRAVARADTILVAYQRPSGFGLSRRARSGGLTVEPPSVEDEGWKRDLRGGQVLRRLMRNCEEQRRSQDRMLMHQTLSKGWCHARSR